MRRIFLLTFSISILFLLFLPNVRAQTGIYPSPILLEPTNGQKLGREDVTFKWAWEGELAEDECFWVEVWELQMEPTSAPLRLTQSTSLSVPVVDLSLGDYQWRVTVVRVADHLPEEELSESETWNFSWGQAIFIGWTLAWVQENIVDILVYPTVSLASITAVVLLSVLFVAELNQMPFRMAWGLMFDHKELLSVLTSGGNYLNERWKDWERIIDEKIVGLWTSENGRSQVDRLVTDWLGR